MNKSALEAIEQNLGDVLRRRTNRTWPDDLVIVRSDGSVLDPTGELANVDILSELEDDDFSDEDSLIADEAYRDSMSDDREIIYDRILREPIDGPTFDVELSNILTLLRETFGGKFPGAPGHDHGLGGSAGYAPPPEVYAFYLPWHYFDVNTWGIYLIVEGVETFARQLHAAARPFLSFRDCKRVAKQFLFHHEAYHNAVETFAARLETSHRLPCYVTGFQGPWKNWFMQGTLHEEGLANAYSANFTKSEAFANLGPGRRRSFMRGCAFMAVRNIIRLMPPEYRTAETILRGGISFDEAQQAFQEENLGSCFPKLPTVAPSLWAASPHAMHPSLSRNDSFSYVVRRSHPAVRQAAHVPHFSRKQVIKQLERITQGTEVSQGSGKHPKFIANGKQVPVPNHTGDFPRGTLRAILRELGINMSVRQFMAGGRLG